MLPCVPYRALRLIQMCVVCRAIMGFIMLLLMGVVVIIVLKIAHIPKSASVSRTMAWQHCVILVSCCTWAVEQCCCLRGLPYKFVIAASGISYSKYVAAITANMSLPVVTCTCKRPMFVFNECF